MRHARTRPPARVGEGELTFSGYKGTTDYVVHSGDKLKSGTGALVGEPQCLRSAFRAGQAKLKLDDGHDLRIVVVAHTEGGDHAYFEIAR